MNTDLEKTASQVAKTIQEKNNILLITHQKMDCDALSSTLALYLLLQKMGKNVTALCQDAVPEAFQFLPDTDVMNTGFSESSDFIITLDVSERKLQDLKWEVKGNKVNILLIPENKSQSFSRNDIGFKGGAGKDFDLIIACDAADIQQLGAIYEENAELFHSVPMLVLDHHASNPGFGNINYISPSSASTTEVIYTLIPVITGKEYRLVDEDIATLLLAGIITDTGSFQHPNTTPKSFEVAADLIDLGARQQEIIKHLFKTKKLTTLKLWGRVLSKIKYDPVHRFVWSTVSTNDLSDERATSDETEGLIDELLSNTPGAEVVFLLKQREDGVISGSLRTTTPLCDAAEIAGMFGGGGHRQAAGFKIRNPRSFEEVIGDIIPKIEAYQEKRLGIPASSEQKKPWVDPKSKAEQETVFKEKSRVLEKMTDFRPDVSAPAIIEKQERALEKREDFLNPQEKKQQMPTDSFGKREAANDEIPNWLYDKPKPQEKAQKEKQEAGKDAEDPGFIPDWLEAAAEKKEEQEKGNTSEDNHQQDNSKKEESSQKQQSSPDQKKAQEQNAPENTKRKRKRRKKKSNMEKDNTQSNEQRNSEQKNTGAQNTSVAAENTTTSQQSVIAPAPKKEESSAAMPQKTEQKNVSPAAGDAEAKEVEEIQKRQRQTEPSKPSQPLPPSPQQGQSVAPAPQVTSPSVQQSAAPVSPRPIVAPVKPPVAPNTSQAPAPAPQRMQKPAPPAPPNIPQTPPLQPRVQSPNAAASNSLPKPAVPVPPVAPQNPVFPKTPPPQSAPPPPPPAPIKKEEEKDLPPLSSILNPNPDPDLIPQMPKTPPKPPAPAPQYGGFGGGYQPPSSGGNSGQGGYGPPAGQGGGYTPPPPPPGYGMPPGGNYGGFGGGYQPPSGGGNSGQGGYGQPMGQGGGYTPPPGYGMPPGGNYGGFGGGYQPPSGGGNSGQGGYGPPAGQGGGYAPPPPPPQQ